MFYSQTYDLAWEHQVLHMLATTGFPHSTIESIPGINNWADHTSFIYYLLAPFYLIFRNVEFMLVTQVLSVAAAAWLLYAYARKTLNSAVISVILAFAFLMHPSVQGYLLEDFHPSVMVLPLFFGLLWAAEKKNMVLITVLFSVMALVREDAAFFSFFCALYFIVSKKVTLKQGLILQGISVAVMALMMGVMHFAGGDAGDYDGRRFYTLGSGFFGVIQAIITNPVFVFSEMFTADKLGFLLLISAPLLFITCLRRFTLYSGMWNLCW